MGSTLHTLRGIPVFPEHGKQHHPGHAYLMVLSATFKSVLLFRHPSRLTLERASPWPSWSKPHEANEDAEIARNSGHQQREPCSMLTEAGGLQRQRLEAECSAGQTMITLCC